jgi:hypothetical protein
LYSIQEYLVEGYLGKTFMIYAILAAKKNTELWVMVDLSGKEGLIGFDVYVHLLYEIVLS